MNPASQLQLKVGDILDLTYGYKVYKLKTVEDLDEKAEVAVLMEIL